jgi:release factor glutamine methyltransferase
MLARARRRWHERAYLESKADSAHEQVFDYLEVRIGVPPDVMPIMPMSHLAGEAVLPELRPAERVLDMGNVHSAWPAAFAGCRRFSCRRRRAQNDQRVAPPGGVVRSAVAVRSVIR